MWRTLRDFFLYPLHIQSIQFLQPFDYIVRVELHHCPMGNQELHTTILLFNGDGITSTWITHVWSLDNPHASMQAHVRSRLLVKICCVVFGSHFIGPFVLEEYYRCLLEYRLPLLDARLRIRQDLWVSGCLATEVT
jgi:hypothetical protein